MNAAGQHDTTRVLEKALPILEQTHKILANNVANANTPGFSPTHVSFEQSLKLALEGVGRKALSLNTTHTRHLSSERRPGGLIFESDTFEPGRNDKSKFNVDKEMVELLRNNGRFDIYSAILTKKYQQMREVLRIT